jgi:hypothetical protein
MQYILGEDDNEILIDSAYALREVTTTMLEQARHSIDLYTPDLETDIYNNQHIEQAMLSLAKSHSNNCIRILVNDSKRAVQDGHCLVRLAQQLTSSVFIHTPSEKHKIESGAFVIVDRIGLIKRALSDPRDYNAVVSFKTPRIAARHSDLFNEAWEHSAPDVQTRRMYL